MNEVDRINNRIRRAKAAHKALRARHDREHEQSREKWTRAWLPLLKRAKTIKETLVALHHAPRCSEARQMAIKKAIDLCNTVDELRDLHGAFRTTDYAYREEGKNYLFAKWMRLSTKPEDLSLWGRVSELVEHNQKRKATYDAKCEELGYAPEPRRSRMHLH